MVLRPSVAMKVEERFFQPGTALNRILREAPYIPRCSDNKTATLTRPREYAVRYPYMQINRKDFTSWLIFDLDHTNPMIWDDVGLPAPNLIVQNRASGKSHLFYAIVPVCTSDNARQKPITYMNAVYEALSARLDADPRYHSGPVAKTPGHPWWATSELHSHVYELSELADHLTLEKRSRRKKVDPASANTDSRHVRLFDIVRHYAYAIVNRERKEGNFDIFYRLVEAYAHNSNNFAQRGYEYNLRESALRATVRSITRWTWETYSGNTRIHRGAMRLDYTLPLPERQRLSALRTHDVRKKETASKVRGAVGLLLKRAQSVSLTAIAKLTKLSRQTVANYKTAIEEALNRPVNTTPLPSSSENLGVKYGARPVTGGLFLVSSPASVIHQPSNPDDDRGGG